MIRSAVSILAGAILGLLAAFALVIAVEAFSNVVHPFPKDFGGTHDEVCRHVERYPAWVLAVVVPMWGAAALAGSWIAQRVGKRPAAWLVGLLVVSGLVLNLSMLPYPFWFKAGNLVVIPAAILAGVWLAGRRGNEVPGVLAATSPAVAPE